MENLPFIHYSLVAGMIGLPAIGVALGQGITSSSVMQAINRQPSMSNQSRRLFILGLVLAETAFILSLIGALFLLSVELTPLMVLPALGIACALGIPGFFVGLLSGAPLYRALESLSRQPFAERQITTLLLATLSIIQTPIIFGLLISFFIFRQMLFITSPVEAYKLLACGLTIGLGSIGPILGLGYFAQAVCTAIGWTRSAYNQLLSFTLMSQAMIETPVLFVLVISIILLAMPVSEYALWSTSYVFLAAALAISCATFGPGISSGYTAGKASYEIALQPAWYTNLSSTSMMAQGFIDSCVIYGFIIALLMLVFH